MLGIEPGEAPMRGGALAFQQAGRGGEQGAGAGGDDRRAFLVPAAQPGQQRGVAGDRFHRIVSLADHRVELEAAGGDEHEVRRGDAGASHFRRERQVLAHLHRRPVGTCGNDLEMGVERHAVQRVPQGACALEDLEREDRRRSEAPVDEQDDDLLHAAPPVWQDRHSTIAFSPPRPSTPEGVGNPHQE